MRVNKWSGSSLTYDSRRSSWIVGGQNIEYWSEEERYRSIPIAPAGQDRKPPFTYESMRFCADRVGPEVQLSASGFTATMTTNNTQVAVANYGFSSGVHFWEIICPISCANIGIGIAKEGWNQFNFTDFAEFQSFKTTTPRVIGVEINLETFTLNFWLNGRYQDAKGKRIAPAKWYPAVRLAQIGTSIILNPFATVPRSNSLASTLISLKNNIAASNLELKQRLATWLLVTGLEKTDKVDASVFMAQFNMTTPYKNIIIPDAGDKTMGFFFIQFPSEKVLEEFMSNNNGRAYITSEVLVTWGQNAYTVDVDESKKANDSVELAFRWFMSNHKQIMQEFNWNKHEEIKSIIEHASEVEIQPCTVTKSDEATKAVYLPHGDSLLLTQGNQFKLIPASSDVHSYLFTTASDPSDHVSLLLTDPEVKNLLSSAEWLLKYKPEQISFLLPFLNAISGRQHYEDKFVIQVRYGELKLSVSYFLYNLLTLYNQMEQSFNTIREKDFQTELSSAGIISTVNEWKELPFFGDFFEMDSQQDQPEQVQFGSLSLDQNWFESVCKSIEILGRVEEIIWLQRGSATDEFWAKTVNRNVASMGRLASMLNHPNGIELAERGIINHRDLIQDYKHYLEKSSLVQNVEWSSLEQQFPTNRYLKGFPTYNISLQHSLANIPPVTIEGAVSQLVTDLGSDWMLVLDKNGRIQMWTTHLTLIKSLDHDFTSQIEEKKNPGEGELDEEEDFASAFRLLHEGETFEEDKEEVIEPSAQHLNELYIMGFPHELAKKALIMVKNEGLEKAIDAIMTLQTEEIEAATASVKSDVTIRQWNCPSCTLVNIAGTTKCELCDTPAPQEACQPDPAEKTNEIDKEPPKKVEEPVIENVPDEPFPEATDTAFFNLRNQPVAPLVVGVLFVGGKLRVRHFAYTPGYLRSYLLRHRDDTGVYSLITGQWIRKDNSDTVQRALWGHHAEFINSLSHLYAPGRAIQNMSNIGSHIWQVTENFELELPLETYYGLVSLQTTITDAGYWFVFGKKSDGTLALLKIRLASNYEKDALNFKTLKVEIESETTIQMGGDQFKIASNGSYVILASNNQLLRINAETLEVQETIKVEVKDKLVELVAFSDDKVSIRGNDDLLQIFKFSPGEQVPEVDKPVENEISELDIGQIEVYEEQLNWKDISIDAQDGCRLDLDADGKYKLGRWDGKFAHANLDNQPVDIVNVEVMMLNGSAGETVVPEVKPTIPWTDNVEDLPLMVYFHNGASYSNHYHVSKMLSPNNEYFSSNYPAPNFIFKHLHDAAVVPHKVTVHSELETYAGGHPIDCGLVFTSKNPSVFAYTEFFNEMQPAAYAKWRDYKTKEGLPLEEHEPVGFFELGDKTTVTVDLDVKRPCQFIYLKPTSVRKKYVKNFNTHPMEIKFFGVQGEVLDSLPLEDPESSCIDAGHSISLEITKESGETTEVTGKLAISRVLAPSGPNNILPTPLTRFNGIGISGLVRFTAKDLSIESVKSIKVKTTKNEGDWDVSSISMRVKSVGDINIRKNLLDSDRFEIVNLKLVNALTDDSTAPAFKESAARLLTKVSQRNSRIAECIRSHLDVTALLRQHLCMKDSSLLNFLKAVSDTEYTSKITEAAFTLIPILDELPLLHNSLLSFIKLLKSLWKEDAKRNFEIVLRKIFQLAKRAKEIRSPIYNILRTIYSVESYPLDGMLFNKVELDSKQRQPLPCSILMSWSMCCDELTIDLLKFVHVNEVRLLFDKIDNDSLTKFRLCIWGHDDPETKSDTHSTLLFSKHYEENVTTQLSKLAYFKKTDTELEALGIKLNYQGRYLTIQVGFSLLSSVLGCKDNTGDHNIIAEVYGEVIGPTPEYKISPVPTITEPPIATEQMKIGHSVTMLQQEYADEKTLFTTLHDSKEVGALKTRLAELQTDLDTVLQESMNKVYEEITGPSQEQQIQAICTSINEVQNELLECNLPSENSMDFILTLAVELSKLLLSSDNSGVNLSSFPLKQYAIEIFESFIVYERGVVRKEALALLTDLLIANLSDLEWQDFSYKSITRFLASPSQLVDDSPQQRIEQAKDLFSQRLVIDALDIIGVPASELIQFLIKKLNVPVLGQIEKKQREINKSDQFLLASVMKLCLSGLKKVPTGEGTQHTGVHCYYCSKFKYIIGTRYMDANSVDLNICSKETCHLKWAEEFPGHTLIVIPQPLPVTPNLPRRENKPILEPMTFKTGNVHTGVNCESCGIAQITGDRYMWANWDYYNVCSKCFNEGIRCHFSFHVFLKLDRVMEPPPGNPKSLIQVLDPRLYPEDVPVSKRQQPDKDEDTMSLDDEDLLPLSVIRSHSTPPIHLKPEKKLTFDDTLSQVYYLTVWICGIDSIEYKGTLLSLAVEMIQELIRMWSVNVIRELMNDSESVLTVIWGVLDQHLANSLKDAVNLILYPSVLEKQATTPVEKQQKEQNRLTAEQTRHLLSGHLLRAIQHTLDSQNIQHLTSLLELYLYTTSAKLPSSSEETIAISQVSEMPINTSRSLISLLPTHGTPQMWRLVVKSIILMDTIDLVESQIFNQLIEVFLDSEEEIQQIIYTEILNITKNMLELKGSTQEVCSSLLKVVIKTYQEALDKSQEEIAESICSGWLDLLLSGKTPLSEKPPVPSYMRLTADDACNLLNQVAFLLKRYVSIGGEEASLGLSHKTLTRLAFANNELLLLNNSVNTEGSPILSILFNVENGYISALTDLLEWLLFNSSHTEWENESNTPGLSLIRKIGENVFKIMERVSSSEECVKYVLGKLVDLVWKLDKDLTEKCKNQEVAAQVALTIAGRINRNMEHLLNIWLNSDELASTFAFKYNGFEFLLDRLGMISEQKQLMASELLDSNTESKKFNLKDEEFANKMSMIDLPGQSFANNAAGTEWAIYKKGNRNKIYTHDLKGNDYKELCLAFDVKKLVELRNIMIGFTMFSTEGSDRIVSPPSSVLVEGGLTLEEMQPLANLQRVHDNGYYQYSVAVFMNNFYKMKNSEIPKNARVRYLKFRIRRPVVTCVESSALMAKNCNNMGISISFISCMGHDCENLVDITQKLTENHKVTALHVLSRICNTQFKSTMQVIAHQTNILNKIKHSFEMLASLLIQHESWLSHIFVAISTSNQDMADWFLSNLLQLSRGQEYAQLAAEIIHCCPDQAHRRLLDVQKFLFSSIEQIMKSPIKHEIPAKFKSLLPFIDCFVSSIRVLAPHLTEESPFEFTQQQADILLQALELNNGQINQVKSLSQLPVSLLYLPPPFTQASTETYKFLLTTAWEKINFSDANSGCESLFGTLVAASAGPWVLEEGIVEKVLDITVATLERAAPGAAALNYLKLLSDMCESKEIKEFIVNAKWHLRIYNSLKEEPSATQSSQQVLKKLETGVLEETLNLLCKTSIGRDDIEREMAEILKTDLQLLGNKRDIEFVNKLLVPLLTCEQTVPVCLHPYDANHNRWISSTPRKVSNQPIVTQLPFTNSKILDSFHRTSLQDYFKEISNKNKPFKKLPNCAWNMVYSLEQNPDFGHWSNFWKSVENKGPFLLVVQGNNAKTDCVVASLSLCPAPACPEYMEEEFTSIIPAHKDNFLVYFEEKNAKKFVTEPKYSLSSFGSFICDYEGGGAINVANELFWLSFSYDYSTCFEQASSFICQEDKGYFPPGSIKFTKMEVWSCSVESAAATTSVTPSDPFGRKIAWQDGAHALSALRSTPLLSVPTNIPIQKFSQTLFKSYVPITIRHSKELIKQPEQTIGELYLAAQSANAPLLDLEFEIKEFEEYQEISGDYVPNMGIFKEFEKQGGVREILTVTQKSLSHWNNQVEARKWSLWVQEVDSFSKLPYFFSLFIKNQDCKHLLFQLLAGTPDEQPDTIDDKVAVKYSYEILADMFKINRDNELRVLAYDSGLITRILERLSDICKESPRRLEEAPKPEGQEEVKVEASPDKSGKKQKKIGVGYASDNIGINSRWDVGAYFQNKQSKAEQVCTLIKILTNFLKTTDWEAPVELSQEMTESALLPILESALGAGSLLDMSKEQKLYSAYLKLVKEIASQRNLVRLLKPVDPRYIPKQNKSLHAILGELNSLANIFLRALGEQTDQEKQTPEELAKKISATNDFVDRALTKDVATLHENEQIIRDTLSLPLDECYRALLQGLRFDYMDMKNETGQFLHHYANMAARAGSTPPPAKLIRLAQELADLSVSLPTESTNAIFIRVDKSRVDMMKALVMGATGTPYAHGAYEYDIFFEDSYPNAPPKCNLETTGAGQIRFNPNLYNCGKVCLSLLGTWRGNATENWDPKLSTVLQVLISIQAIIMSDDVYFNEPGFESEAGTPEGDRKNEGYSNIVRYGNVKFAMIGQLKNPSKGFETVIRRHFYLKRKEILEEAEQWLHLSRTQDASYTSLVADHNHNWASQFKQSKEQYTKMLEAEYNELKELLENLAPPSGSDVMTGEDVKRVKEIKDTGAGVQSIEEVDMSDDPTLQSRELNVDSAEVKDRWSRYIGAMGIEAVAKQSQATVFLSGAGALGIEIAKNIVLSGVRSFTFHDVLPVREEDLSGQFFASETSVGNNRAETCAQKLQQLNYYVKVTAMAEPLTSPESLADFSLVILTDTDIELAKQIGDFCHAKNIPFIYTQATGVFGNIFCDFGEKFTVVDKNGEELQEVIIEHITNEEQGVVTLLKNTRHDFQDGDTVMIHSVEGMDGINDTMHKVTVLTPQTFKIGDTTTLPPYIRSGLAKQVKTELECTFKPLSEHLESPIYDPDLYISDFEKMWEWPLIHVCMRTYHTFVAVQSHPPKAWDEGDADAFLSIAKTLFEKYEIEDDEKSQNYVKKFSYVAEGVFAPLNAYLGGIVAQEAIKSMTRKYTPIRQSYYYSASELIPKENTLSTGRNRGLQICVGQETVDKIESAKIFMVGCGAIGCELLKNYAMINLGVNGEITVTDPDIIEVSNLNRQFLFREKHLRKPKSVTASAAAIAMNPALKGHVLPRLDKVHEGTSHIFDEAFFENLDCVTNALDNVQARRYIDTRCVSAKTALLESGTLGPKGHVQTIIPYKTESYGSQNDPADDLNIPMCTLKMFPEEALHCVEWARDLFGKYFTEKPKGLQRQLEDKREPVTGQEVKSLKDAISVLQKRPKTFEDCVVFARHRFQKYFDNDIQQLLHVYPLDCTTSEGTLFWSLPKRPPHFVAFDPSNALHAAFITSLACLWAQVFGLDIPETAHDPETQLKIAESAAAVPIKPFVPNDEKAKEIASAVEKEANKTEEEDKKEEEEPEEAPTESAPALFEEFLKLSADLPQVNFEEFEKDDDKNFHIDFIHAAANLRVANYGLEEMDWITVKLKAGRIVPALVTTTAAISGLQTLELVKLLAGCEFEIYRNSFLNLALPQLTQSEPCPPPVNKLTEETSVTVWDRWEVKLGPNITLKELLGTLEETYKLIPRDVFHGTMPIYLHAAYASNEEGRNQMISKTLSSLIELEDQYADLTITFAKSLEEDVLEGTPAVRVFFN